MNLIDENMLLNEMTKYDITSINSILLSIYQNEIPLEKQ